MTRVTLADLVTKIEDFSAKKPRILVALFGAPGSGKSTLAEVLADHLGDGAVVLPMDGFHLDNAQLREMGMLKRKGAPDTFDVAGFADLLRRVSGTPSVSYPTFDRTADKTVPDSGRITADAKIVIVEGNYLLLKRKGWADLSDLFDVTVGLEVGRDELSERLVQRWLDHGMDPEAALARATENDLANADVVLAESAQPDFIIVSAANA